MENNIPFFAINLSIDDIHFLEGLLLQKKVDLLKIRIRTNDSHLKDRATEKIKHIDSLRVRLASIEFQMQEIGGT